jgi:hypothetical protein
LSTDPECVDTTGGFLPKRLAVDVRYEVISTKLSHDGSWP